MRWGSRSSSAFASLGACPRGGARDDQDVCGRLEIPLRGDPETAGGNPDPGVAKGAQVSAGRTQYRGGHAYPGGGPPTAVPGAVSGRAHDSLRHGDEDLQDLPAPGRRYRQRARRHPCAQG